MLHVVKAAASFSAQPYPSPSACFLPEWEHLCRFVEPMHFLIPLLTSVGLYTSSQVHRATPQVSMGKA